MAKTLYRLLLPLIVLWGVSVPAFAQFAVDPLADTAGNNLTTHADQLSNTWAKNTAATGNMVFTAAGTAVRNNTAGQIIYYSSATPGSGDYYVQADFKYVGSVASGNFAIDTRASTGSQDYYEAKWQQGANNWQINRWVAGVNTNIGTNVGVTLTVGNTYRLKLKATTNGSQVDLVFSVNDTPTISVSDTNAARITATGKAGLSGNGAWSDTTGALVSNFWAATNATPYASPVAAGSVTLTSLTIAATVGPTEGTQPYSARYQRAPDSSGSPGTWADIGSAQTGITAGTVPSSFSDTGLTGGTKYWYRLKITDSAGTPVTSFGQYMSVTTVAATIVGVTDSNLYWSPYTWYSDGSGTLAANNVRASSTYALSNFPGSYFKLAWSTSASGTGQCIVNYDAAGFAGLTSTDYPKLRYSLDGGAFTSAQITSSGSYTISSTLSSGTHTLWCYFDISKEGTTRVISSPYPGTADRWNGPASVMKITGIALSTGDTTVALSGTRLKIRPNTLLVYGDSITQGSLNLASGSDANPSNTSSSLSWPIGLAAALNAEVGMVGSGGQGWTTTGQANVPTFPNAFNLFYTGQYRTYTSGAPASGGLLSPAPTWVVIAEGKNDGATADATITAAIHNTGSNTGPLKDLRAAAGASAYIFVGLPIDNTKQSAITAGYNNYRTVGQAGASDTKTYLVNINAASQEIANISATGLYSSDGTHPYAYLDAIISGAWAQTIKTQTATGTTTYFTLPRYRRGRN